MTRILFYISPCIKRAFALCLLLTLFLSLSAQQRWFSVDVRHPAVVTLPQEAQEVASILLVNNSVVQPEDFGHQNTAGDKTIENSSVDLTDAARQLLFGAEKMLFEQECFGEITMLEASQNSGSFFRQQPLSSQKADSLCVSYGVEALLVLNQLVLYDKSEIYITVNGTYANLLTAYCSAQWSFYLYGKASPFRFSVADTLYWDAEERTLDRLAPAMPERQEALLYLAHDAGERMAQNIVPQWTQEDRFIYLTKRGELSSGLEAFTRQDWLSAIQSWQIAAQEADNDLTVAYAFADMAVAAEMAELPKEAVKYVDKAIEHLYKLNTSEARRQIINLRYYKTQISRQ